MKRSRIVAIIGIVGSITALIIIASMSVRPYLGTSTVVENKTFYDNQTIQVIGIVQNFTGSGDFDILEGENSIRVYVGSTAIPSEVQNGVQVVVTGLFNANSLSINASQILSQCSNSPTANQSRVL